MSPWLLTSRLKTILETDLLIIIDLLIAFSDRELRMICENQELAMEKYGENVSGRLMDVLSDIEAASNISDILIGNPKTIKIGETIGYRINLVDEYALYLVSGHAKAPLDGDGKIDWNKVSRIKISSVDKSNE